ncbi:Protein of unknown function [Natronoarchaeum philippinense]|uniref:DUF4013 domain-containing protein n=1 Tax=Natronoarchaeum philippinense TaxID=558529 RepID=A0A285NZI0_NATPI|nr:DUF4013 domain-containing protein [Natronoarchaeum philippinense]SNZ13316.1 Protein of unknown function [Natronoarchaeum philippinense]
MISDALRYPYSNDEAVRTLLIGGLLALTSVLVVPAIVLVGYAMRVIRSVAHGSERAPVFEDWGDMFREGVRGTVVAVAYALLTAAGAVVIVGGAAALSADASVIGTVVLIVGGLLWLGLAAFAAYVTPAALANVAEEGRIADGFDVGTLRPVLTSGSYATAWLIGAGFVLAGGVVSGVFGGIPAVAPLVAAFVGFYAGVAAYYVIGRAWGRRDGVDVSETDTESVSRPAA